MSDKINLGSNGFTLPMPMAILGTVFKGTSNFMAVAWCTRVNYAPPMLIVALNQRHASHEALRDTGVFSLNFPDESQLAATDYVGLVSGHRTDKSAVFTTKEGTLPGAPLIAACPYALECKVAQRIDLPSNSIFVAEIVATWAEERILTDGVPDLAKLKPFMLSMPDNRYWSVGEVIGKAWHDGKELKRL
ncbi:MAG: flavin reductase family protein [Desulfovibrionaceae bacterium]